MNVVTPLKQMVHQAMTV